MDAFKVGELYKINNQEIIDKYGSVGIIDECGANITGEARCKMCINSSIVYLRSLRRQDKRLQVREDQITRI